jgi:hypothetical protein
MKEAVSRAQKRYASWALTAAILIGFGFILAGYKPVGKGLVLGTLFSIINFILIGQSLPLGLEKSKRKAFLRSLVSIILRYALMAVPLVVAVKYDQFNLIAAICGLFAIQLVILADYLLKLIRPGNSGMQ